jgi:hypothetical protein
VKNPRRSGVILAALGIGIWIGCIVLLGIYWNFPE